MSNTTTETPRNRSERRHPEHVERNEWAATALDVSLPTAYRMAQAGQLPGAFKIGSQWRISVPLFNAKVHGESAVDSRRCVAFGVPVVHHCPAPRPLGHKPGERSPGWGIGLTVARVAARMRKRIPLTAPRGRSTTSKRPTVQ